MAAPRAAAVPARPASRWTAALVALLAVGAVLRFVGLDGELWYDEIVTLVEYVRLPFSELVTTYTRPNNHILYSLLARVSIVTLGESAFALRLPAALFGIASLAALYAVAIRVVPRIEALLATALVTLSYHHVWFSQNARGYTGLMLCGLVATSLLLDGLRDGARRRSWVGYGVVLALGMYIHLSAAFFWVCHGIVFVAVWLGRRVPALSRWTDAYPGARSAGPWIGFGVGALLTLALYGSILPAMFDTFAEQSVGSAVAVKVGEWQNPIWTLFEIARGLGITPTIAVLAVAGVAVVGFAWFDLLRRDPVAALLMALPFPVTLGGLLAISFHIWPRYFFPYGGFVALLAVHGIFRVAEVGFGWLGAGAPDRAGAHARRGALIATCAVVLMSASMLPANYANPKQAFAAARDFVEAQRGASDSVVTSGLATFVYQRFYATGWGEVLTGAELAAEARRTTTWLVYTFPAYMRTAHASVLEVADAQFDPVGHFPGTLGGGDIYVFRSPRHGP